MLAVLLKIPVRNLLGVAVKTGSVKLQDPTLRVVTLMGDLQEISAVRQCMAVVQTEKPLPRELTMKVVPENLK